MEIAARENLCLISEHKWIVRHSVGLVMQRCRRLPQDGENGAHDLRLTAETIWILHSVVVDQMGCANGATREQSAQRPRHIDLGLVPTKCMNTWIEWRIRSAGRVGGQRADDQCRLKQRLGLEQRRQSIGRRELRPI